MTWNSLNKHCVKEEVAQLCFHSVTVELGLFVYLEGSYQIVKETQQPNSGLGSDLILYHKVPSQYGNY